MFAQQTHQTFIDLHCTTAADCCQQGRSDRKYGRFVVEVFEEEAIGGASLITKNSASVCRFCLEGLTIAVR